MTLQEIRDDAKYRKASLGQDPVFLLASLAPNSKGFADRFSVYYIDGDGVPQIIWPDMHPGTAGDMNLDDVPTKLVKYTRNNKYPRFHLQVKEGWGERREDVAIQSLLNFLGLEAGAYRQIDGYHATLRQVKA